MFLQSYSVSVKEVMSNDIFLTNGMKGRKMVDYLLKTVKKY